MLPIKKNSFCGAKRLGSTLCQKERKFIMDIIDIIATILTIINLILLLILEIKINKFDANKR